MFNTGQYFAKTETLGIVASRMYIDVLKPVYFHAGQFESRRFRHVQQQGFRPESMLVKQPKLINQLRDF
jgi:hypothetical protein